MSAFYHAMGRELVRSLRVIRADIAVSALLSAIHNTGPLPRPTEPGLPVAFLRRICKQRTQPLQLLRPSLGRSGEHDARAPPKSRHTGRDEPARKLLPGACGPRAAATVATTCVRSPSASKST